MDLLFDSWDPGGDGTIDFKELQKALKGEGAAASAAAEEGWGLTKRLREALGSLTLTLNLPLPQPLPRTRTPSYPIPTPTPIPSQAERAAQTFAEVAARLYPYP